MSSSPHPAGAEAAHTQAMAQALGEQSTDKRVDVLRAIARTGSISQAAREVGVSYKGAWQAIDTLTNLAGLPLVDRAVGGAGGGGARLTADGARLLRMAQELAQARQAVLQRWQGEAGVLAPALGLRTSLRNQWHATVQGLQPASSDPDDPRVQVVLALAGEQPLRAQVTRESAELLDLRTGLAVLALAKATAVEVTRQCDVHDPRAEPVDGAVAALASDNALAGVVVRSTAGRAQDELSVRLVGAQVVVGFAQPGAGLREGDAVCVHVPPSAIVIALPG